MLIQGLVPLWGRLVDASLANDDDDNAIFCMSVCALNFPLQTLSFPYLTFFACKRAFLASWEFARS